MSSGSQIISYLTPEAEPGVTPASPEWDTLRLTGNTMTPNVNTETSDEIRPDRMAGGSIITSLDYQGDLNYEFSAGSFDQLLEAAFYGNWTDDVLEIGSTRHTFSHVKGYRDIGVWATFKGLHIGTMTLDIPEEGKITGSFTGMALESEDGTTNPTVGDTINPPLTTVPMGSATSVGDILINGQTMAGNACVSSLSLTIDNSVQMQRCLGRAGPGAIIATRANITGQMTMAWSAASYQIWKRMITREAIGITFPLEDAAGNRYLFEIPQAELDGDLPDGGNEDIVQVTLDLTAKLQPVRVTRTLAGVSAASTSTFALPASTENEDAA